MTPQKGAQFGNSGTKVGTAIARLPESYIPIVTIVTSYGAVTTQRETGFSNYRACATEAVAGIEPQEQFYPDARLKWECERADD